ncbi:MAG: hypothetical protein KDC44_13350, partial [Phaeodactylibacter sp.]|nr:hypothetical protein [Phaeodactylibacter sp.]
MSGVTTPILTVASGGTYVLTVTNTANSCFSVAGVTVLEDTAPPIADAGPDLEITCVLQEVPLFGFGSSIGPDFTYQWTTPDGNIISGATTPQPIVNEPGVYTLTVTDISNGCTASSSATVGVDSNVPIANAGPNQTLTCFGAFVTLNGSGSSSGPGFTYTWSTANGNIVSGANTLTPQVNAPGLYELTVINTSNGCVALSFVTVDEDIVLPTAVIAPPGEINCNTPQITLDASGSSSNGNFSYVWNTSSGNIVSGQGTLMPVVDQGGNYILTIVNNATGCMSGTNVMVEENIDNPVLQIAAPGLISCTEPQIQLDAGGSSSGPDFQYTWTTSDGTIISGSDGQTPTIASGGTYELTILNLNTNCSTSGSVTVPENADLPTADIDPAEELNCTIEQIQLNAAIGGGNNLTFSWTTANGNIVSGNTTLQPLIDAPGDYLLTVLNEDTGCQTSTSI